MWERMLASSLRNSSTSESVNSMRTNEARLRTCSLVNCVSAASGMSVGLRDVFVIGA